MSNLGKNIVDELLYYDKEYWCKVYFNCEVKCDSIDNNMCDCFNSWILAARHKTIISMLEEIRVKVMTRLARLSEFPNTWVTNFSPMALKVLEANIDKSMRCNIEFNGVTGYEVLDGYKQHTVCLRKMECSCRSWMLKGIPCAHALAAMLHKQYDPHDFIHPCYSKDRYIQTYSYFMQPMNNMAMWPESANPIVTAPLIKKLPGRPKKLRRKKAGESKVSGKMSKIGVVMTCSLCHVKGNNKRGCSLLRTDGVGSTSIVGSTSTVAEPSTTVEPSTSRKGKGRPKKPTNNESELAAKRGRCRPRTTKVNANTESDVAAKRGRGRPRTNQASTTKGAPTTTEASVSRYALESWFTCSQGSTTVGQNTNVIPREIATVKEGAGPRNTTQFERSSVTGMGVFQVENGFKTLNPGLSGRKILSTGPKTVLRSSVITGDIEFKPSSGLK